MREIEQPPGLLDLEFGLPVLAGRFQLPTRRSTVHGELVSEGMAFEMVQSEPGKAWRAACLVLREWQEGTSAPPAKRTACLSLPASRLPDPCSLLPHMFFPHMPQEWVLTWGWRWGWDTDVCGGRQRPLAWG